MCLKARDVAESQLRDAASQIERLEAENVKLVIRIRFMEDQFLYCAIRMAS